MSARRKLLLSLTAFSLLATLPPPRACAAAAQTIATPKDLNTLRQFPDVSGGKEWQARAREIREQALVSCGLWPMPEKTALNARVFGRIEREGYTIEKVYFETYPGFYLAGNLYRPLGRGKGPFPAILNPHGHWSNGRMADEKDGSIAARCINFARRGMVAFCYDMVGYNDTHFADSPANRSFSDIHRGFATKQADLLWNISLMGLQTWNSIRALDFLESLPDVDRKRLACTGASGGGTQTFMLGAVDDRLAAQVPAVMVSHSMQGGCLCENAPGLRVQFSNMEIAAAAAPRPQLLVAATGDWTKDTLTIEGPSIARVYDLLHARNHFRYVRYDFGHNYNQTSREAVYGWFAKWLLREGSGNPVPEQPYHKEPDADLRVFPDGQLPASALTQEQLIRQLKESHQKQWRSLAPRKKAELARYQRVLRPAWRHTLQLAANPAPAIVVSEVIRNGTEFSSCQVRISRSNELEQIEAVYWAPASILNERSPKLAVLCDSQTGTTIRSQAPDGPRGLARELLARGVAVLNLERFSKTTPEDQFDKFYATYNRTRAQERVGDLLTLCTAAPLLDPRKRMTFDVTLVGAGRAGLWALLAAPGVARVVADCDRFPYQDEDALLAADIYCPGVMNLGSFEGIAMLAAPRPLLLHNLGAGFSTEHLQDAYHAARAAARLTTDAQKRSDSQIADWIASKH